MGGSKSGRKGSALIRLINLNATYLCNNERELSKTDELERLSFNSGGQSAVDDDDDDDTCTKFF